jgi:hypothetical protein
VPLRVWITDGSLPVFRDTERLETRHAGTFGMSVPYEGFVDPAVESGTVELEAERVDDVLCLEAEWCVLTEGLPDRIDASTPVRLQGLIEGKWMNRLLGTKRWQPASIANSLLADGPGIETTLDELERNDGDSIEIAYISEGAGRRTHSSSLGDLHGHSIVSLVNEVLELMRVTGDHVDAIDLGALGTRAAVVNEPKRIRAAALPLPLPHVSKERLVRRAIADGVGMRAGTEATILATRRDGTEAGRGTLTWRAVGA